MAQVNSTYRACPKVASEPKILPESGPVYDLTAIDTRRRSHWVKQPSLDEFGVVPIQAGFLGPKVAQLAEQED